jgi:ABC-type sugar transport system permease subunit
MKRPRIRWHIAVFLAPAVLVYTTIMILPLFNTLRLALYSRIDQERIFVGLQNFMTLFGDPVWADAVLECARQQCLVLRDPHAGAEPDRDSLAAMLSHPAPALQRSTVPRSSSRLSFLRDRRLCLETDPVPDLGHRPDNAGCGRSRFLSRLGWAKKNTR